MIERLGPIRVWCDAPPYAVVEQCAAAGFRDPADVRWLRLGRQASGRGVLQGWRRFLGLGGRRGARCACGQGISEPERVTFVCGPGSVVGAVSYRLAQCPRCRTMLWDEA
jgi:hypothetical protein